MNYQLTHPQAGCTAYDDRPYEFDNQGQLLEEPSGLVGQLAPSSSPAPRRPCSLTTLDGSWLIELTARGGGSTDPRPQIRGPMRIEVGDATLRISGDVYVRRNPAAGLASGAAPADSRQWYPQLPPNEYSWYFRSKGVSYASGELLFDVVRHLWDRTTQDFVSTDEGRLRLICRQGLLGQPRQPVKMHGTAVIGGRTYQVQATKTSSFYRGCRVEVDVMTNRAWPASALTGSGAVVSFQDVYASAGWDLGVAVDEVNVPEDVSLSMAELQTLIATHRGAGIGAAWHLWLLVGSSQGNTFGVMFDQDQVPREGAVGFADARLSDLPIIEAAARGRPLGEVPAAFLRTLVHEAGHALNLFHPKHDVHAPPIGTEIMNQTGDVMGFATVANPYPGNAAFAFADHDRTSLVHAPDPQVRPGWKPFGWGHGTLSAGLPEPVDAEGLIGADDPEGVRLDLNLPENVYSGEYAIAELTLTNTGDTPREVSKHLNLAEGDLRLLHAHPSGPIEQTCDIVVACGPRELTVLEPGQSLTSRMQVFFTSEGVTFAEPGLHKVRAEFDLGTGHSVRSARSSVRVRMAGSSEELDIAAATLDHGVATAIALGDFGHNDHARVLLAATAEAHNDQDTGAACALVLANSFARSHTDYRDGDIRATSPDDAKHFLDLAVQGRSAEQVVGLAVTVASPVERDAPVVERALTRMKRARKPQVELENAEAIAQDFTDSLPR